MNEEKLKQIQKLLDAAEGNLHSARNLLRDIVGKENAPTMNPGEKAKNLAVIEEGKVIEGVYNGESMVGPDGKEYPVPANYASKSKLVEGDVLKLTIAEDGSFIFKQINPVERRKTIGTLVYADGNYTVTADGKNYKVLQASVTYYKGEPGDQVTIILPKDHETTWAAVENIMKSAEVATTQITENPTEPVGSQPEQSATEESTESETSGPEIEFPKNDEGALSAGDQEIVNNLQTSEQEDAKTQTDEPASENPDEGIKELEI